MKKALTFLCAIICFSVQGAYLEGQAFDLAGDALSRMDSAFAFNSVSAEITTEDAYYLGRAVAANVLAVYKPYTQNPDLTLYLNRICQTLVINSSLPALYNGYHVIILDSPDYNAFATSGGHIFVTKKLVSVATSEDMLAAILAHEIAHITLKHSISIINDVKFTNEMTSIANRAAELSGTSETDKWLPYFRASVNKTVDVMMKNGYSQAQEFDADREAAELLLKTEYNPGALVEVLEVLQKTQSSQRTGFVTTHPSPAERISNVKKLRIHNTHDTRRYRLSRFKDTFLLP